MKFREFMALQLFAEDEGTGAESNGSGVNGEETQGNEGDQGTSGNTFEDFLRMERTKQNLTGESTKQSKQHSEMRK